MSQPNKRQKRLRLFNEQGGLCCYCKTAMRIIEGHHGKAAPDDMATFEHLDDRHSPERGRHAGEKRIVLACRKCNVKRGREVLMLLPIMPRCWNPYRHSA